MSTPPLKIRRDGLWAILENAQPYRAAIESVGGKWRADNSWRIPLLHSTFNQLARAGVPLGGFEAHLSTDPWLAPGRKMPSIDHANWNRLYGYQQEAVRFLCQSPYPGTLLALSCGLGKTPTSIVAAEVIDAANILVLAPKVLVPVWRQEREKWATVPWNDPKQDPLRHFVVTNWEWACRHEEDVAGHWGLVIIDESVLVKNRRTQRFKLAKKLRKNADRMWLLSGSPITRYIDDLWTQMHLVFPDAFTSYWRWVDTYCYTEATPWSRKLVTGSRNFDYPQELKDLQFTRNQAAVLPDLPDFVEQNIPVELAGEQKKLYDRALNDFLVDLQGEELPITNKISQLVRLQQLVSHPANCDRGYKGNVGKLEALLELLDAQAIALPLLVWTYHRQTAIALDAALARQGLRSTHLIGGMDDADASIGLFKDGHVDVLVLSQGVGKYGLTLTNVMTVVYYDKTWDADAWTQSLSRVRRIGLDHVFHLINLHCPRTTDDLLLDNLAEKAQSIARVNNADLSTMLRAL